MKGPPRSTWLTLRSSVFVERRNPPSKVWFSRKSDIVSEPKFIAIGQRVRINEEPSEVPTGTYAGEMAVVQGLDISRAGDRMGLPKIDRETELVRLPEAYLETIEALPSSFLANDLFLP